jgi:hypothetical protein
MKRRSKNGCTVLDRIFDLRHTLRNILTRARNEIYTANYAMGLRLGIPIPSSLGFSGCHGRTLLSFLCSTIITTRSRPGTIGPPTPLVVSIVPSSFPLVKVSLHRFIDSPETCTRSPVGPSIITSSVNPSSTGESPPLWGPNFKRKHRRKWCRWWYSIDWRCHHRDRPSTTTFAAATRRVRRRRCIPVTRTTVRRCCSAAIV